MSLFLEFHVIQNFVPSNLNRDDTGAPKDALFGGQRRARISSQCLKRAIRQVTAAQDLLPPSARGIRTKRLKELLLGHLEGRDPEEAGAKIEAVLSSAGLAVKDDGKTEYLLFLGQQEVAGLAALITEHWDELVVSLDKKAKKGSKDAVPPAVAKKVKGLMDGGKAVDVALFGRMLADLPSVNQDAACQVAHAISTHRVEREFDYFTAVDDQAPAEETGAGMIGQVEFNSATFYRYAAIDLHKLLANLQGDRDLLLSSVKAFTLALARAIPSGKQNTFAAHNPPEFIGLCIRRASPINLANAFEKAVSPKRDQALSAQSVQALADYESKAAAFYGSEDDQWLILDLSGQWPQGRGEAIASLPALAEAARSQVANAMVQEA